MRIPQRAALLPLVLIGLCSCAGRPVPVPPPVVIRAVPCPEPTVPALPPLDGGESFDALPAWDVLMERDDIMRAHINALRRSLACYRAQATDR